MIFDGTSNHIISTIIFKGKFRQHSMKLGKKKVTIEVYNHVDIPSVESPWNQWKKSMESMYIVRLEYWNENTGQFPVNPWKMSMEFFQYVRGIFPVCPWNFSTESMDFFHSPWRLSRESVDKIHGQCPWKSSMDNVHGICPGTLWTKSMDNVHGIFPWTLSTDI